MDKLPNFLEPLQFMATTLLMFGTITGRFFLIAGLLYGVFYKWFPVRWQRRKVNLRRHQKLQFRKKIRWSMLTAFIFSVAGAVTLVLWQKGWTRLYLDVRKYPLWWLPLSLIISLLLHETYYYWLHRRMHRPKVFRIVHKVHHDSHITPPWTAFSLHPLESLLQAIFLPLLLLILPLHFYVLLVQLIIRTFSSVINHLNIEIYPRRFHRHFTGKWLIGATHHSLHHQRYKNSFGLYFTFWDKWKNTESPLFDKLFDEKTY
jgi:Delta7-sterol 5-desaturase